MSSNGYYVPEYGSNGFTCPNCQAYSQQRWMEVLRKTGSGYALNNTIRTRRKEAIEKKIKFQAEQPPSFDAPLTDNVVAFSTCLKCFKESYWVEGNIIYPRISVAPFAHDDMPEEVKEIYNEARNISDISPRASSALLRLAVEKLLPLVGAEGKSINDMIHDLVKKGLSRDIQMALDGLRVIGNEYIHPGKIEIQENNDITMGLFKVLNIIVENLITHKKDIQELYDFLPNDKKQWIEARDAKISNK